jgi:hypothetical protein
MPFDIVWENRECHIRLYGEISDEEIFRIRASLLGDPRLDRMKSYIFDMLEVTASDLSARNLKQFAFMDLAANKIRSDINGAFVVSNPEFRDQVISYLSTSRAIRNKWQQQVFDNMEKARQWLDSLP